MVIIGIDQSLTETGVIVYHNDMSKLVYQEVIKSKPEKETIHRMITIKERLRKIIHDTKPVQGVMEGFGFGARGNAIFELGGLGYIIRELFVEEKIPLLIITPTTLKKYVTGKGNIQKDLMIAKIFQKWGIMFENHNAADAYALARIGYDLHYVKSTGDIDFLAKNNLKKELLEDHYDQIVD